MARALRAVAPDEKPARKAPVRKRAKSVTAAASSGTTRELLAAMRTRIAKAVEDPNTPARDLASLTKRLMEVAREIEAIDAREEEQAGDVGHVPDEDFDAEAL